MIRVKGDPKNQRVFIGLDRITRKHKKAIRDSSFDIGRKSRKDTRRNILTGRKTGVTYNVSGKVHQASAPGESPANMTRKLARSVDYDVRGHKQVEFGYKELYGEFLEEGTRYMDKRPNLRKVLDDNTQTFINYMVRSYRENS